MSIYLSIHPSIHPSIDLSVYLSIYLSMSLSLYISISLYLYLSIDLSIYLSIDLSIYRSINLSIYQSINLSIHQSINLSIYQSIYLSIIIYGFISQPVSLSLTIYLSTKAIINLPCGLMVYITTHTYLPIWKCPKMAGGTPKSSKLWMTMTQYDSVWLSIETHGDIWWRLGIPQFKKSPLIYPENSIPAMLIATLHDQGTSPCRRQEARHRQRGNRRAWRRGRGPSAALPVMAGKSEEKPWTTPAFIWANYNNSLTWIKAIWGWFPWLTMIPVRSQWGRYNLPRFMETWNVMESHGFGNLVDGESSGVFNSLLETVPSSKSAFFDGGDHGSEPSIYIYTQ